MKSKFLTEFIICHYDEIGLKGKNRKFFEEKLKDNIKQAFQKISEERAPLFEYAKRISGRIIIKITEAGRGKENEIKKALENIFGIAYFAFAIPCGQNIEDIKKAALEILSEKKFKTFRISCQRSKKEFPLISQEVNEQTGEYIIKKLGKKVKLKNPDAECFIEIVDNFAFIYLEKTRGQGGLPSGISGKVVALLSGGIDSPVAVYYILKRGASAVFLHFHSLPYTSPASLDKAKELAVALNKFQLKSKIYFIPFAEIQKQIMIKSPAKMRVILYRRFMMRIAEEISGKEGALAIVTGESLGQVASQTLENMAVIEECVKIPILRPLVGFDKKEIIAKAKEIDTYDISILPHEDCCSLFVPKHPETKAKTGEVVIAEKNLDVKKLVEKAIKNMIISE